MEIMRGSMGEIERKPERERGRYRGNQVSKGERETKKERERERRTRNTVHTLTFQHTNKN